MEPIILYEAGQTPNPIKVAIVLEELGLPFNVVPVSMKDGIKKEPYISINPNGRLPSIEDPNTGVKLFESGAIIEYLVDTYDKDKKFQYSTPQEKWITKSWLYFQMSGQGPYFGQIPFFTLFHHEKGLTSVIERFENEVKRVTGVIDAHLKKTGNPYVVGEKISYADLAWIPWYKLLGAFFLSDWNFEEEFPHFAAWRKSLLDRPAVQKIYAMTEFQSHGHGHGKH